MSPGGAIGARYRHWAMRRLRSSDGVRVAVHDLGGLASRPPLLLVHGTGFCAQVFARLAVQLSARYHCLAVDLRGHGLTTTPDGLRGPNAVTGLDYAWTGFADDVLAAVDGLAPLVAVGHSAGGAALLLAEAAQPGTFSALWCYEPIVWPDPEAARGRAEWLAEGARRRRDRFPTREDAYTNFASKPPFNSLAPACLRAYVEHGFEDDPTGGVRLRCRPEVEGAIYLQGVEGDRFGRLPDVKCPVVVACGARTEAIAPPVAQRVADALPDARVRVFKRLAHFGPLEDPQQVGEAILEDFAG